MTGAPREHAFHVAETGEILTVTPYGLAKSGASVRYHFNGAPNDRPGGYPLDELFASDVPTPKEAMHHPSSVLMLWGKGLRAGWRSRIRAVSMSRRRCSR
ncbi:MAG: hypothetical protein R3B70_44945 [Polyangiaceae bacterium]